MYKLGFFEKERTASSTKSLQNMTIYFAMCSVVKHWMQGVTMRH